MVKRRIADRGIRAAVRTGETEGVPGKLLMNLVAAVGLEPTTYGL